MPTIEYPWPHAVLDDFLPPDAFAELLAVLKHGARVREPQLPQSVQSVCRDPEVLAAIADRFSYPFSDKMHLEVAWTGKCGLRPHNDRADKEWSGQIYLAGEAKGTELYDEHGKMVHEIEWKPNRLSCWTMPAKKQQHGGPKSEGRHLLLYWIMRAVSQ
jgi:hypothetical protein